MNLGEWIQCLHTKNLNDPESFSSFIQLCEFAEGDLQQVYPPSNSPDDYVRKVLHDCEDYEVVLFGWPPGAGTPIHNHGLKGTVGAARVLKGSLYNRVFEHDENNLHMSDSQVHGEGAAIAVPRFLTHAMGNASGDELAISLHLYGPKIVEPRSWDPDTYEEITESS